MNNFLEREAYEKSNFLAWQWFPRSLGFWIWFTVMLYNWKINSVNLDKAALMGFGAGVATWVIFKIIILIIGNGIIHINLWEYGCGCIVKTISIELFHYIAIATICILANNSKEISSMTALGLFVIGSLNWFLVSFKNL